MPEADWRSVFDLRMDFETVKTNLPVVGYRQWIAAPAERNGQATAWKLMPINTGGEWVPGLNRATCMRQQVHEEKVPFESCSCGLHALRVLPQHWPSIWAALREHHVVCGSVLLSGKILCGENFLRAQRATIVALMDRSLVSRYKPLPEEMCESLANHYGVRFVNGPATLRAVSLERGEELPAHMHLLAKATERKKGFLA